MGCQLGPRSFSGCAESRGNIFHSNASKTWIGQGNYSYNIELNLGPKFNIGGPYGLDTVALAEGNATGGPSLDGQVVATVATVLYYTGMFGLNNQPNNLSTVDNPHPSYLTSLKTKNLIPSLSWAYTAGAWYRKYKGFYFLTSVNCRSTLRFDVSLHSIAIRDLNHELEAIIHQFYISFRR